MRVTPREGKINYPPVPNPMYLCGFHPKTGDWEVSGFKGVEFDPFLADAGNKSFTTS